MIERKFVAAKVKEFEIQEYVLKTLGKSGISHVRLQPTPLGEKIIVYSSHPGLVIGKAGETIKKLTTTLKKKFELENPQIEISEIQNQNLDAQIVADRISYSLERYGTKNFKGVMHKTITDVMNAGAKGVEIVLSGRQLPSSRAKSWRVLAGYMKKCGDIAISYVLKGMSVANLKSGTIGIKVSIMPADLILPDHIEIKETPAAVQEIKVVEVKVEEKKEEVKEVKEEKKKNEKKSKRTKVAERSGTEEQAK